MEAEDGTVIRPFPSGVPRPHAGQIASLVRERDLTRTLETGLGYGLSALAICEVHEARSGSIGLLNLRRAGLDQRVRVIEMHSDEALPVLRAEGVRLDFALIDGRHLLDTEAVAYVVTNRAYEELDAVDHGMAILRKLREDDRAWDFHRDFPRGRRWPTVRDGLRNLYRARR